MKWVKAIERFPDNPNEKVFRRKRGGIYQFIQTEEFNPEYLVFNEEEISYNKLEWLDESQSTLPVEAISHINAVEKGLTQKDISRGMKRRYIPAKDIVKDLEEIKNNPGLWKAAKISGSDQYQGGPMFLRNIDAIIFKLQSPEY